MFCKKLHLDITANWHCCFLCLTPCTPHAQNMPNYFDIFNSGLQSDTVRLNAPRVCPVITQFVPVRMATNTTYQDQYPGKLYCHDRLEDPRQEYHSSQYKYS